MEEDFTKLPKELSDEELVEKVKASYKRSERNFKMSTGILLYKIQAAGHDVEDFVAQLQAESEKRWEICETCPSLIRFNRCKECGCFMKIKTKLVNSSCPLDKWGKFKVKL